VEAAANDRMFRFAEDIETALDTEKRRDNAAHVVGLIEALDVLQLPPEHEIAQLADRLLAFCQRGPATAVDEDEDSPPSS